MTAKSDIERHFSRTADVWRDRIYRSRSRQGWFEYYDKQYRFDYTIGMIEPALRPRARALDVGCGAGQLIPILDGLGYRVDAIDISKNMVEHARRTAEEAGGVAIVTTRNVRCLPIRWRFLYRRCRQATRNALLRPLGRETRPYREISREHDPNAFCASLRKSGFRPLVERYVHYHALPAPLNAWFTPLEAVLGKSLERLLQSRAVPALASTYIVKSLKLPAAAGAEGA